jgi:hypothetical protein
MELFQRVNFELVRFYGNSFGHFTKTVEIGLSLWLEQQNELIEPLKDRNRALKSREMYQTLLKERKELIAQIKENNILIDEVVALKKKLANEIELSIEDRGTEVTRKK